MVGGLVGGLLPGAAGGDGLLGGLLGDNGLVGGLLGDDGLVGGLVGGLLPGATGSDGLLGGLLGDNGLVGGLLGGLLGGNGGLLGGQAQQAAYASADTAAEQGIALAITSQSDAGSDGAFSILPQHLQSSLIA